MLLAIILVIVVLTLVLVLVLLRQVRRLERAAGGTGTGEKPPVAIPDRLDGPAIAGYLTARLAGTPADGSAAPGSTLSTAPAQVVWVDGGDEVLVHLDSTSTQIVDQTVLVSIDLESDQTGRTPLVVAFALPPTQEAGLVVATDEYPRGNGLLASRWGRAVQAAAWSAMLTLAADHASERGMAPLGLAVTGGQLHLVAGQSLTIG
jgi:hypothetical protein